MEMKNQIKANNGPTVFEPLRIINRHRLHLYVTKLKVITKILFSRCLRHVAAGGLNSEVQHPQN